MTLIAQLKALVRPTLSRVAGTSPLQTLTHRATYLGRFHAWLRAHPCPELADRVALYALVSSDIANEELTYLEFGVYKGHSIRWWADHCPNAHCRFVGFDSFEGLPDTWGEFDRGHFSTAGQTPDVADSRVQFVKGWFSESLSPFLAQWPLRKHGGRLVVHLDADLFSSTIVVLMALAPLFRAGDLLLFDEFGDYLDEFRALEIAEQAYGLRYRALGHTPYWTQVALRLI